MYGPGREKLREEGEEVKGGGLWVCFEGGGGGGGVGGVKGRGALWFVA